MKKLKKKWQEINNRAGVVTVTHKLFGKQKISVDVINAFFDDRIGVQIKKQKIYIPIQDITKYVIGINGISVESDMKKIEIKLSF